VEMKIPKGTQVDTKLLMRGKGIMGLQNRGFRRKGDQIVHLKIEIPKKVTARQEELLREFDEISRGDVVSRISAQSEGFFSKMFGGGDDKADKADKDKEAEEEGEVDEKKKDDSASK